MPFVLDASVTLAWHFLDENAAQVEELAEAAAEGGVVVPRHWQAEVANALLMGERRGRTSVERTAPFLERLCDLHIQTDFLADDAIFSAVLPLARAHGLTVYDALYLELAERRGLPLATVDAQLADAARSVGVEVLP